MADDVDLLVGPVGAPIALEHRLFPALVLDVPLQRRLPQVGLGAMPATVQLRLQQPARIYNQNRTVTKLTALLLARRHDVKYSLCTVGGVSCSDSIKTPSERQRTVLLHKIAQREQTRHDYN